MSLIQRVAAIAGIGFIAVAALGFAMTGWTGQMTHVTMASAPRLFGLFPVNPMHNLVHLLLGIWGVASARRARSATVFAAISGIIYLVLAGLGYVVPTGFGMVPIGGYDILLHFVLAGVLIAFAFAASLKEETELTV